MKVIRGRVWVFGDNIDTDMITPGQYLKLTPEETARHVLEGADPYFPSKIRPGDIIVAGRNFGCGSSRESAPTSIKQAGIGSVVAVFFARIFFRNAINVGLPVVECPDAKKIQQGDVIEIDLVKGVIHNISLHETYKITSYPKIVMEILENGGLVKLLERKLGVEGRKNV